jgi:hypothetical protein
MKKYSIIGISCMSCNCFIHKGSYGTKEPYCLYHHKFIKEMVQGDKCFNCKYW